MSGLARPAFGAVHSTMEAGGWSPGLPREQHRHSAGRRGATRTDAIWTPPGHTARRSKRSKPLALPVVIPGHARAALGRLLGELRAHGAIFEFDIDLGGITPVIGMVETLWVGLTDRHSPAVPVNKEAAEAAVGLAVALVEWFSTGRVRRR